MQILNFVRVAVQSRKVNLLSADLDSADSVWYTLAIDSRLQDFTVSLSGLRPKIILKDPKGEFVYYVFSERSPSTFVCWNVRKVKISPSGSVAVIGRGP